jgi:hypothetical protein
MVTPKRAAAAAVVWLVLGGSRPVPLSASDHADPIMLRDPDANITDLFFFPDPDPSHARYIVILDVHRALTAAAPYQLENYEYQIHFDWHTGVSFPANSADTARYGGVIAGHGETIDPDGTITIHLDNNAGLKSLTASGGWRSTNFDHYTGVRDDPFIFPRFFRKNTIAMVIGIPKSAFPTSALDRGAWLLWAAAFKGGKQVDHVGRSNRTQQARFDTLNTLPPKMHVDEVLKRMTFVSRLQALLDRHRETQAFTGAVQLLLLPRAYDKVPDVMVYSEAREQDPATRGFPNGRHLEDDVAAQTCAQGDCILQEISFIDGGWPRQTKNDKPFLRDANGTLMWPFLAEPWKESEIKATPPAPPSIVPLLVTVGLILLVLALVVLWLVVQGIKYRLLLRRQRQAM